MQLKQLQISDVTRTLRMHHLPSQFVMQHVVASSLHLDSCCAIMPAVNVADRIRKFSWYAVQFSEVMYV